MDKIPQQELEHNIGHFNAPVKRPQLHCQVLIRYSTLGTAHLLCTTGFLVHQGNVRAVKENTPSLRSLLLGRRLQDVPSKQVATVYTYNRDCTFPFYSDSPGSFRVLKVLKGPGKVYFNLLWNALYGSISQI